MCQINDSSFIIFGGFVAGSRTDETFVGSKNGSTIEWKQIADASPSKPCVRSSHTISHHGGKCYIFGGQDDDNNKLNDVWELDLASGVFKELTVDPSGFQPIGRSGHTTTIVDGVMYVFGGILELTKEINELLTFDFKTCRFDMIEGYTQEQLERQKKNLEAEAQGLKRKLTMKKADTNVVA